MADQLPAWAREIARRVLADALPDRWAHTQGVAAQARAVGPVLGWDTDLIEAAAWLHDIGYAPALAVTGFHPLDGARYLRDRTDAAPAVCALVAHHSGAVAEAGERGLSGPLLAEFPLHGHSGEQVIAVTYCDFTTGPGGERLSPEGRIAEILSRYEPDSAVHRAVQASAPHLLDQCREVTTALTVSMGGSG
ncbi:MAG: HD domain-containing protein [Pseudonocardiaceae bacterium]